MIKHKKIILGVIIILLLVAVSLTVLIINKPAKRVDVVSSQDEKILPEIKIQKDNVATTTLPKKEIVKEPPVNIVKIAEDFVERFGSFSNHSNYSNINDLVSVMTAKMKAYVRDTTKQSINQQSYYSITTRVINSSLKNKTDNIANVIVRSQRQEFKDGQTKIFYQDAKVELVKEGNKWLVDSLVWQ